MDNDAKKQPSVYETRWAVVIKRIRLMFVSWTALGLFGFFAVTLLFLRIALFS